MILQLHFLFDWKTRSTVLFLLRARGSQIMSFGFFFNKYFGFSIAPKILSFFQESSYVKQRECTIFWNLWILRRVIIYVIYKFIKKKSASIDYFTCFYFHSLFPTFVPQALFGVQFFGTLHRQSYYYRLLQCLHWEW